MAILIVGYVSAQSVDDIPQAVKEFYETESTINKRAPTETAQFGQLSGIWYCTQYKRNAESQEFEEDSRAYWAWKYILDGYGVQDFWYQGEKETPYHKFFQRDLMLTQIRVYDTKEEVWKIAFINNNAGEGPGRIFGLFTAKADGDEVVMEWDPQDPDDLKRIIFYDITEDSFSWRVEQSKDAGESWAVTWKISADKLM